MSIEKVAGGYRFITKEKYSKELKKFLHRIKKERLSPKSLETLAIISYKQPVTAPELAQLRGVDSSAPLKSLLSKGLIRILGRKKVVGKPFLYGTTEEFLVRFGLESLDDLPDPDEFESLFADRIEIEEEEPADEESYTGNGEPEEEETPISEGEEPEEEKPPEESPPSSDEEEKG